MHLRRLVRAALNNCDAAKRLVETAGVCKPISLFFNHPPGVFGGDQMYINTMVVYYSIFFML